MKVLHTHCDCCNAEIKGYEVPDSWHEFYYEFNGKEIEYTVCSFDCYVKQLSNILQWSIEHTKVKIGGMSRVFVHEFLNSIKNPQKKEKEKIIHWRDEEILPKEVIISTGKKEYGYTTEQDEFLSGFTSCYKIFDKWQEKFPDSNKKSNTIYQRWLQLKNDKLLEHNEVERN
jgi:hypothetical protein